MQDRLTKTLFIEKGTTSKVIYKIRAADLYEDLKLHTASGKFSTS